MLFSLLNFCMWDHVLYFIFLLLYIGPPLWFSGQSAWLQIQKSKFDSRHYQIFWEVVGLERDPLGLVSTNEELLGKKSSGSGLEIREYSRRDLSYWPHGILYPRKLALTLSTSSGRLVAIVHSWTQATELFIICYCILYILVVYNILY
jgi:hypothetical protein